MTKEALLDQDLPEDAQFDFDVDQLQRMSPRNVDSVIFESYGGEGTTQLVCLPMKRLVRGLIRGGRVTWETYPVHQCPIPTFNQERELPQHTTQQSVLEYGRVR